MGSMINFGLREETHRCQSPLDVPEVINFENHFSTFDLASPVFLPLLPEENLQDSNLNENLMDFLSFI